MPFDPWTLSTAIQFHACGVNARSLPLAVLTQQPSSATDKNALKQQLQLKLDEWHKAGKFPGTTLGVVLANGESFSLAVGYSDRDAKTPMQPTDRMLAGSVGKTFAAATASRRQD